MKEKSTAIQLGQISKIIIIIWLVFSDVTPAGRANGNKGKHCIVAAVLKY